MIEEFVMMVEMGFFVLTGQRYQMAIPAQLNMDVVKKAALKFAQTEDSVCPASRRPRYHHAICGGQSVARALTQNGSPQHEALAGRGLIRSDREASHEQIG